MASIAEDELHAVGVPAIQVLGLREVGVAAEQHLAEAARASKRAWPDRPPPAAPSCDGRLPERLTTLSTSPVLASDTHQRMIAPGAVVGDVHALLALAGGLHQRAVHVDAWPGRRTPSGCSAQTLLADVVEDVQQRVHVVGL